MEEVLACVTSNRARTEPEPSLYGQATLALYLLVLVDPGKRLESGIGRVLFFHFESISKWVKTKLGFGEDL